MASLVEIIYNNNITYDIAILNRAIVCYQDYIHISAQHKRLPTWVLVFLVTLDNDITMEDIVNNSKILTIYYEIL
jgi:hypothetical protein